MKISKKKCQRSNENLKKSQSSKSKRSKFKMQKVNFQNEKKVEVQNAKGQSSK